MTREGYQECQMVRVAMFGEEGIDGPAIGVAIVISTTYNKAKETAIQALKEHLPPEKCKACIYGNVITRMLFPPITRLVFLWTEENGHIK